MSTSEGAVLLIDDRDGIRTLTLNRPQRKNAIDARLWHELADALRATARDDGVRALVITGAGGAFCSGADIGTGEDIHPRHKLRRLSDVALALHELAVPTVAKVTGVAVGAGWNLALGCDLVVATPDSRFCQIFSKRGPFGRSRRIVAVAQTRWAAAGEAAGVARGHDRRRARPTRSGWSRGCVPAEEIDAFVDELAGRLAAGPPFALAQSKALLNDGADSTFAQAVANEARAQPGNFATADSGEAYAAFAAKRQPTFTGRWAVPPSRGQERSDPGDHTRTGAEVMRETVIVGAVRTPVGKRNGGLSAQHAADLSAVVLNELAERTGVDPNVIDDVVWGCVSQVGDQSSNIGRYAVLAAGWPEHIPGTTVNRACGSSQQALDFAVHAVMSGQQDVVVAGGVEVMSRVPLGSARSTGMPYGPKVLARYDDFSFNQGISAELIAQKWNLSRTRLDEYSAQSHERAAAAQDAGAFIDQIVPVFADENVVTDDEGIRRGTTTEKLAGLKPAFTEDGVIHAGNSSQISDGAAALLVTTAENAVNMGLTPLVRYRAGAVTGADPVLMLTGPIPATDKVLHKAGVTIDDVGVYEVNEAFAPVPLAWLAETGADEARLNPLGGAIALGHPLGASGAVLMTRMIHHMRDNGIRYGLQTMCEGGGTANATLVELIA